MTNKTKYIIITVGIVLLSALLFFGGIYVGKKRVPIKEVTKIEYVKGETIHDTIVKPDVKYITRPIDTANIIKQCVADGIFNELFPEKHYTDTIVLYKEDTTKIMADWATKRDYEQQLFDIDTVGKLTIKTFTQYNRLGNIEYTYTPINKKETTTVFIERKFLPYIGIGLSTFPSYDAEIGLFYRKSFGFSIEGNYYPKPLTDDMLKYSIGMKVLKMF